MSEAHPSPSPIDVLVADDDPDCRRLVRDALAAVDRRIVLHEVADGAEALRFLLRRGPHGRAPRPRLIYLDLEMPGASGQQVLRAVKTHPQLRAIPVVMMTGAEDARARMQAARQGVNSYVVKPVDPRDFLRAVVVTARYWLSAQAHRPAAPAAASDTGGQR